MKQLAAIGFVALMLVLSILYAWFRLSLCKLGSWENPTTIMTVETAKHVVTPSMAEASRGMVFRQAPAFTLKATDGTEYSLGKLIREGPLVLTSSSRSVARAARRPSHSSTGSEPPIRMPGSSA